MKNIIQNIELNNTATTTEINTESWSNVAELLYEQMAIIKDHQALASQYKDELKELSHFESYATSIFMFKKNIRKGSVDYKKIEVLKEIDLELYRKAETESWTLISIEGK